MIRVEELTYRYPTGFEALRGINLEISRGEKAAIIGQNGAGKTSLVKHFNGLLKPTSGNVIVNGVSTREKTTAQLSRWVGYVFQNPDDQLFKNSIREELAFGPQQLSTDRGKINEIVDKIAHLVGLEPVLDKNPYDLSLSDRKFVSIASVLTMNQDVVILDEPTAGQSDDKIALLESIIAYLEETGKTIIAIAHDMEFVAGNFERVIVLKEGSILMDGSPDVVFAQPKKLGTSHLRPPYISRLCLEFDLPVCFTVPEFVEVFADSCRKKANDKSI
ncbi:MAG: ABC transporter ATP-binding protein [Syntrophomonadaceae bacterium]|nr:ABC transporter ATP-binding protein [Syntrophomonadaceae bacterium]